MGWLARWLEGCSWRDGWLGDWWGVVGGIDGSVSWWGVVGGIDGSVAGGVQLAGRLAR